MALYDPEREPAVEPADAAAVVHAFLVKARAWAIEREIPKRIERVREGHDMGEAAQLHAWVAWQRFVEHTLREIEDGTLDHWFVQD